LSDTEGVTYYIPIPRKTSGLANSAYLTLYRNLRVNSSLEGYHLHSQIAVRSPLSKGHSSEMSTVRLRLCEWSWNIKAGSKAGKFIYPGHDHLWQIDRIYLLLHQWMPHAKICRIKQFSLGWTVTDVVAYNQSGLKPHQSCHFNAQNYAIKLRRNEKTTKMLPTLKFTNALSNHEEHLLRKYPSLIFNHDVDELRALTHVPVTLDAVQELQKKISRETVAHILLEHAGHGELVNRLRVGSNERQQFQLNRSIPTSKPYTCIAQMQAIVATTATIPLSPIPTNSIHINTYNPLPNIQTTSVVANVNTNNSLSKEELNKKKDRERKKRNYDNRSSQEIERDSQKGRERYEKKKKNKQNNDNNNTTL